MINKETELRRHIYSQHALHASISGFATSALIFLQHLSKNHSICFKKVLFL